MIPQSHIMRVLMWRHMIVRKHKIIWFIIELLSTVSIFFVMFYMRSSLFKEPKPPLNSTLTSPLNIPVSIIPKPSKILYSPDNFETEALMDAVSKELGVPIEPLAADKLEDQENEVSSQKRIDDNLDIYNIVENGLETVAVVEFKNLSYAPAQLEYEIKMKNDQSLRILQSNRRLAYSSGTFFKPFLRLQWAIDKSYMKIRTGEKIDQDLYLQELSSMNTPDTQQERDFDNIMMYMETGFLFGLMLPYIFATSRLSNERVTGVMELINMAGASRTMLMFSHFLNSLPSCLAFSISVLFLKFGNLLKSCGFLLFLLSMLHAISIILSGMLTSFITDSMDIGIPVSIILYLLFTNSMEILEDVNMGNALLCAISLLIPSGPIFWFYREMPSLEKNRNGMTMSTMFTSHNKNGVPVVWSFILLLLQIPLYGALLVYLAFVRPGNYGTALSWNFLWKKNKPWVDTGEVRKKDSRYFEEAPEGKDVGIKVINVSKAYGEKVVVDNISMDIYKGDITVLLGHNGAGKTTLMSVITGMTSPSAGEVHVNGKRSTQDVRRSEMGLCPQHNVFLPCLTVKEHVIFFAMLKGKPYKKAKATSAELLEELLLSDKAKMDSRKLSGGMMRRLQLACALSGETKVLILDEPTSGLDVETRRELWNLLLKLRGTRTTLLSTHFMEEADALGDRIAAMTEGHLVCYATPIVLKNNIGTGYVLTIVTNGVPDEPKITETVVSYIPEAKLRESVFNILTYNLSTNKTTKFPPLFKALESQKDSLEISTIGVGMSSLEEVFHKLCSNVSLEDEEKAVPATFFTLKTPPSLYFQQMLALLKRLLLYIWSTKINFILFNTMLPLLVIFTFIKFVNPSILSVQKENKTSYSGLWRQPYRHSGNEFLLSEDISEDIKKLTQENDAENKSISAVIKMNSTMIQIFFSPYLPNAAGDALNLASNAILNQLLHRAHDANENFAITTYSHDPAPLADNDNYLISVFVVLSLRLIFILIIFFITVISVGTLLKQERKTHSRWLHIMAGCPVVLHWFCRLLFHFLQFTLTLVLPIILMFALFDGSQMSTKEFLGVFMLILLISLLSWQSFIYLMSFTPFGSLFLYVCVIVGLILGIVGANLTNENFMINILCNAAWVLLPTAAGSRACVKSLSLAVFIDRNYLPGLYYSWNKVGPLKDICLLVIQFIYQMALIICIEEGCGLFILVKKIQGHFRNKKIKEGQKDENVKAEAEYVEEAITHPNNPDIMLVHKLHKTYFNLCRTVHAVNDISFSVKKGECFGLLGVNGAGKSTTFAMMTAQTHITEGKIWANGNFLQVPHGKYLKSLSYCPQFLGVDSFLSAYQNLTLLLKIRGLKGPDIKREARLWLEVVGLQKLSKVPLNALSGGCKRRASTACALCSAAPLTLMDEPTSGVDVTARRRVWYAVRRALRAQRAVIITSHSMDEMEALCGRVGIMSAGEMCALGSVPALRAQHARGFSLIIKVATTADAKENQKNLEKLTRDLKDNFQCTLRDQHQTMLHYHIDENMPYSDLFTKLESVKEKQGDYIENYSVSETTLEEVFLSFAKVKQDP